MAGQSANVWDESFKANADLSAKQFQPVKLTAQNVVDVASAATDRCVGILQNKPKANNAAVVRMLGKSKGLADGSGTAIAVGDLLGPNGSGVLVKKATADYNVTCIANEACTVANVNIEVLVFGPGLFRTLAG